MILKSYTKSRSCLQQPNRKLTVLFAKPNSPSVVYAQFLPLSPGTSRSPGTGPHRDPELGLGDAPGAGDGWDGNGTSFTPRGLAQSKVHHPPPPAAAGPGGAAAAGAPGRSLGLTLALTGFAVSSGAQHWVYYAIRVNSRSTNPPGNGRPADPPEQALSSLAQGAVRDRGGERGAPASHGGGGQRGLHGNGNGELRLQRRRNLPGLSTGSRTPAPRFPLSHPAPLNCHTRL